MKKSLIVFIMLFTANFVQAQNSAGTVSTSAPAPETFWTASIKTEWSNKNLDNAIKVGGAETDNQFRLAYKLSDKANLGVLIGAKYNIASEKEVQSDQAFINSDLAIAGLFIAPSFVGSDKTEIDARLHLPTSEASNVKNQNYYLRTDIKLPYSFESDRRAQFVISPRFIENEKALEQLEILTQAKFGQGKMYIPYIALNHRVKMIGDTSNLSRKEEYMGPEVGLEVTPHKLVKLYGLVSQERNIYNPTEKKASSQYSFFNRSESKYLIGAQIKM